MNLNFECPSCGSRNTTKVILKLPNSINSVCEDCGEEFWKDDESKIEIKEPTQLMVFIVLEFGDGAKKQFGLVPLCRVFEKIHEKTNLADNKKIEKFLIKLKILHKIELRMTKSGTIKQLGLQDVDIQGTKYGFLKIIDYSTN